ncbi:VWD domain-containing protein [Actinoplanes sp. CA-051413]|uniref:VWD domain-containing protein n=1 Tax=Actinoplanes sp. CA-051413 TaxID=3239899 RepID=UPI003D989B48
MMRAFRRTLLALLIWLVALAMVVSAGTNQAVAAPPPPEPGLASAGTGDPCNPNSTQSVLIDDSPPQCIAEETRSTRVRVKNSCITGTKALWPDATYSKLECRGGDGIQAEAIAQARAIAQLNARGSYGPSSPGGISPNLQWETQISGGGRPDLFIYDRGNPDGGVGLVEMKIDEAGGGAGIPGAQRDMVKYLAAFPETASGRDVKAYSIPGGFTDRFFITFGPCKYFPDQESGNWYTTHTVPGTPGVLVSDTVRQECPRRSSQGDEEDRYEGEIGADRNHNNIDDFLDYLADHPEHWHLPSRIPKWFAPAKEPVRVLLTEDALLAFEEGLVGAGESGFPALIEAMGGVAVESQAAIATGDAVALGMTAEELAVAELLLADAGVITLGTALVVAAVVIVVAVALVALWKLYHGQGNVYGEPHLGTLDGLAYDLQSHGEFHLMQVPDADIDLQARFEPGAITNATRLKAIAFQMNGTPVEIRDNGTLLVNDEVQPTSKVWIDLGNGGVLWRKGNRIIATFPGADPTTLSLNGTDFTIKVPAGVPTRGLLGNNDGIPGNDLVTASGEQVTGASAAVLHGRYADSWRITQSESLFTYADSEDTETHTNRSFPPNILTLSDFSEAELNAAATACRAQNVPEGPQFDDCMFDIALTGDDSYAQSAAAVTDFLQDPTARSVSASGTLTEGYEGTIPANLRPVSLVTVPDGKAAGPVFDKSGYSFSVPALPSHADVTVALDLYVFGMRDGEPATGSVAIKADGLTPVTVGFTPTAATVTAGPGQVTSLGVGESAAGQFSRYRVTLQGGHLSDHLRVSLEPNGFRGLLGTSLAVDNLSVALTLVAPQNFTVGTTSTVSDGVPAAGAGQIETRASHDVYSLTVAAGASEYLDLRTCPRGLAYDVYNAAKARVKSGTCTDAELMNLAAGTYTIDVHVSPTATVPASYSFALSPVAADVTGTLATNGTASTVTTTVPGQNARATFSATANQRVIVTCAETTALSSVRYTLLDPSGATVKTAYSCPSSGLAFDTVTLPTAGTWTIAMNPTATDVGAITLTARTVPADVTATATVTGTPVTVSTTAPGQDAKVTFTATAGLRIYVKCSETASLSSVRYSLLDPAGKAVKTAYSCPSSGTVFNTTTLATAGTYTVHLNPTATEAGGVTLTLFAVPADVTATSSADGSPVTVTTTTPGQSARFTFAGTAGQRVYVTCGETAGIGGATYTLSDPTGASMKTAYSCPTSGKAFDTTKLATTGTHTITVDPDNAEIGTITLTIYSVPADATATATANGSAVPVTTTQPGQNAKVSFTGAANQRVYITCSETTALGTVGYALLDTAGTAVKTAYSCPSSGALFDNQTLTAAGTYTITINPSNAETGTTTLAIYTVPADVAVAVPTNGTATGVTTTAPGQNAKATFTATANQRVFITCTETTGLGSVNYALLDPAGTTVKTTSSCLSTGTLVDTLTLTAAGTYTITINPDNAETGTTTLAIYTVPADAAVTVPTNGTATTVTTTAPGQNAKATFTATANQRVFITCSETAGLGSVNYALLDPSGTTVKTTSSCLSTRTLIDTLTLTAAGTYTITINPDNAETGTTTLAIYTVPADATVTVPTNGTATTVTTTAPGQNATATFTATASQKILVTCAETASLGSVNYALLDPAGTSVKTASSCPSSGTLFASTTLTAAGTYTITINPDNAEVGTVTLAVKPG